MRRTLVLVVAAFWAVSIFGGSPPARYWVALRHPARVAQLQMLRDSSEIRAHAVRTFESVDAFAADLTPDDVTALKQSPEVRYVTPVVERHASFDGPLHFETNGSPYTATQTIPYGVTMVHAPEVWRLTKGAGPVNVAVLDTGVDAQHPDLAPNIAGGYNTYTGSTDATDDNGHGTHVAGTIAALDNGFGVVGVAPEAHIWAVKVLDNHGFGADENVVAGVDWVIAKKKEVGGDWIINLSLGSPQLSYVERDAFKRVIDEGIIVAAAAGNEAADTVQYPAAYPGVIAVGAVDSTETLALFSNHGPQLTVVGPGVQVVSTAIRGSVPAATVTSGSASMNAVAIEGSSRGEIAGAYVVCGLGKPEDFPAHTAGKIAVIERGELTFNEKVRNAQAAHAVAVIIYNRDNSDYHGWTLLRPDCSTIAGCDDNTHPWPLVLAVSADDGHRLVDHPQQTVDMGAWMDDYKLLSGTSMATPHVAGVLALVWSLDPTASAARLRDALLSTADDLGVPGVDPTYGYGLVDARGAAKRLAPWRFVNPQPVEPRRAPRRP